MGGRQRARTTAATAATCSASTRRASLTTPIPRAWNPSQARSPKVYLTHEYSAFSLLHSAQFCRSRTGTRTRTVVSYSNISFHVSCKSLKSLHPIEVTNKVVCRRNQTELVVGARRRRSTSALIDTTDDHRHQPRPPPEACHGLAPCNIHARVRFSASHHVFQ